MHGEKHPPRVSVVQPFCMVEIRENTNIVATKKLYSEQYKEKQKLVPKVGSDHWPLGMARFRRHLP